MPAQPFHPPNAVIEIDRETIARLRPEAARRDLPVAVLVRDLLDIIAADKLTAAILDDGVS